MDSAISIDEWVRFLGSEYLESFIKDGGASVKFAVTPGQLNDHLALALAARCRDLGYHFVEFSAATNRAHMPQDIFFAISQQIDWRLLARRVIIELARRQGYKVTDIHPTAAGSIYGAIGSINGLDDAAVLQPLRVLIQDEIFKNRQMARDFRVAMSHLCLVESCGLTDPAYIGQPLIDWLTGANTRISNVRHFSVHTPINRTTARHYIESAFHWIRYSGYSGVLLLLDSTRVTLSRRPQDGSRYYTKAMVIDHYELLRELIDSTDRFSGALVVVATDVDFMDQDSRSRGFGAYQALMTRVMNDVRDRNLANPMASLVRLS